MGNSGPLFHSGGKGVWRSFTWAVCGLSGLVAATCVEEAQASYILFNGTVADRTNLTATAKFEVVGTDLQITLTNTDTKVYQDNKRNRDDVLTALFFDIYDGDLSLTFGPSGALVAAGSSIINGPAATNVTAPPSGTKEGGWAYEEGVMAGVSQTHGLGTVGFSIFSADDVMDKSLPSSQRNIADYSLISSSYVSTENLKNNIDTPLVMSSLVFTLGGVPVDFDLARIGNVRFQYGTSVSENSSFGFPTFVPTNLPNVPEPTSLALAGFAGLGVLAGVRRRKVRSETAA